MKKIVAINETLKKIIERELSKYGGNLNHIDVSAVTNMYRLFRHYESDTVDISEWDVSNVESMEEMFRLSNFNGDLSAWNVSKVENMRCMFYRTKFNQPIGNWNTKSLTNSIGMFAESEFNQDIHKWNTKKLKYVIKMFENGKFNALIGATGFHEDADLSDIQIAIDRTKMILEHAKLLEGASGVPLTVKRAAL